MQCLPLSVLDDNEVAVKEHLCVQTIIVQQPFTDRDEHTTGAVIALSGIIKKITVYGNYVHTKKKDLGTKVRTI